MGRLTSLDTSQFAEFTDGDFLSSTINLGTSGILEGLETNDIWKKGEIKLRVSIDGINFKEVQDADSNEPLVRLARPNCYIPLNGGITRGILFVKLERETAEGDSNVRIIIRHVS